MTGTPNSEHPAPNAHDWRGQCCYLDFFDTLQNLFVCASCGATCPRTPWASPCPAAPSGQRHATVRILPTLPDSPEDSP